LERANFIGISRLKENDIPTTVGDVRSFHEYDCFDILAHATASANVGESIQNPIEYFNVNSMDPVRV
jgi:UDP-glucose 4-epimerase